MEELMIVANVAIGFGVIYNCLNCLPEEESG